MSDYAFWAAAYRYLPIAITRSLFFAYTFIQLYWLGLKYLFVEARRRHAWLGGRVRKLRADDLDLTADLRGHVAIITGGGAGIGLHVSRDLHRRGCTVVIGQIDIDREPKLRSQIIAQITTRDPNHEITKPDLHEREDSIHVFDLDLRDFRSVHRFASRFIDHFGGRLNLLINNAGVMYVDQRYTVDGFEHHYQINYLGHALLTELLLPALRRGASRSHGAQPSRIVNLSSSVHYARDLFLPDLQSRRTAYSPFHAYAQSKLCLLMWTYSLAAKIDSDPELRRSILVNAVHPGVVHTDLYRHVWIVCRFPALARRLLRTPSEGAETVIFAACSRDIASGGRYYEDCAPVRSSAYSYREEAQTKLFDITNAQIANAMQLREKKTSVCE